MSLVLDACVGSGLIGRLVLSMFVARLEFTVVLELVMLSVEVFFLFGRNGNSHVSTKSMVLGTERCVQDRRDDFEDAVTSSFAGFLLIYAALVVRSSL